MKRAGKRGLFLLALCAGLTCTPVLASAAGFPLLGFKQMEDLIAANKGKIVMINFFATWCPPCREEIPSLIRIRKDIDKDKLVLIGASVDEDDDVLRAFVAKMRINYPVEKAGDDLVQAAGVSGIPHMLIFDGKGEVVGNAPGFVPEDELRKFLQLHME